MAHQTKRLQDPSGKRLIVTDNFYTRHVLAKQTEILSDGEIKMIGTVKFINIGGINRTLVKEAMEKIQNRERGLWILVKAFEKTGSGRDQINYTSEECWIYSFQRSCCGCFLHK